MTFINVLCIANNHLPHLLFESVISNCDLIAVLIIPTPIPNLIATRLPTRSDTLRGQIGKNDFPRSII